MSKSRFSLIVVSIFLALAFVFGSVLAGGAPRVSADTPVDVDAGPATIPITPTGGEEVRDKTPNFAFTKAIGHTDSMKYRIYVWDYYTDVLVYSYKGIPTCLTSKCWFDPETPLKYEDITETKGLYYWKVQAKTGINWSLLSDPAYFKVESPGFYSTFDTMKKWLILQGTWTTVYPGYLMTETKPDKFYSVIEKHLFSTDYMFEVRMKRKGEIGKGNYIMINGYPYNSTSGLWDDGWDDGYMIGYNNIGYWFIKKRVNGVETQLAPNPNEVTPAVVPYKWNKLTVYVHDKMIYLWINEQYVGKAYDENFIPRGWVGIGADDQISVSSPIYVDWAELEYVDALPYPQGEATP